MGTKRANSAAKHKVVSTHDAKTNLSRYLAEAEKGAVILIASGERPRAKLVALDSAPAPKRPRVGTITSAPIRYEEGAFDPLSDDELEEWGL